MSSKIDLAVQHIRRCLASNSARPLFVGLQGPQGSGKSFLCARIPPALASHQIRAAVLSIDDLYLPHNKLRTLATEYQHNSLLQGRGQPGTHDIELGVSTFEVLSGREGTVRLPAFDKALHGGEGDRVPGPEVHLPLDVVVVEGWCTGFSSLSDAELDRQSAPNDIREINELLRDYVACWWSRFHAFIQIAPEPPDNYDLVYTWRLEQEHHMKESNGGKGMSDEQVVKFVDRYIPGYKFFGHGVLAGEAPWKGKGLQIIIDEKREVVKTAPF